MDISSFLAKAWGLYFIVTASCLLASAQTRTILLEISKERVFLILSGFIAIILGILSILSHNIWTSDWRTIVTLLGWLTFVKGILRFLAPDLAPHLQKKIEKRQDIMNGALVAVLFIGIYLLLQGS